MGGSRAWMKINDASACQDGETSCGIGIMVLLGITTRLDAAYNVILIRSSALSFGPWTTLESRGPGEIDVFAPFVLEVQG